MRRNCKHGRYLRKCYCRMRASADIGRADAIKSKASPPVSYDPGQLLAGQSSVYERMLAMKTTQCGYLECTAEALSGHLYCGEHRCSIAFCARAVGHIGQHSLVSEKLDLVNHPAHYNTGKIEVIEFIEDQKLTYNCGNAVKYVSRAGKKDPAKWVEDLEKAIWYLKREVALLKGNAPRPNDMGTE